MGESRKMKSIYEESSSREMKDFSSKEKVLYMI